MLFIFFFSSRRRHTRSLRDWSSDVCSSDLHAPSPAMVVASAALLIAFTGTSIAAVQATLPRNSVGTAQLKNNAVTAAKIEIGRASCRERVEISRVAVSLIKHMQMPLHIGQC